MLYAVASMITFLLLYSYLRNDFLTRLDREIAAVSERLNLEYLTGEKGKNLGTPIPVETVAEEDIQLFQQKIPGLQLLAAFENNTSGNSFLNVIGAADGKLYQLRPEQNGEVYSRRINIRNNLPALRKSFSDRAAGTGSENVFFALVDAKGKLLVNTELPTTFRNDIHWLMNGSKITSYYSAGHVFRLSRQKFFGSNTLFIGVSLRRITRQLEYFASQYVVIALAVMIPAVLCGWLVARRFIAGVVRVGETAQRISAGGDFSQRVAIGNEGAEIDEMVEAFNRMTANTERLFGELRVVTDNIAHDLKTPLTRMRGMAEVAVFDTMSPEKSGEVLGNIAEECDNMVAMINNMLEITRTETRLNASAFEMIDFAEMLRQAYELFEATASDKGIELTLDIPHHPVMLPGDKFKLQRLIANLVDNAIKFTPSGKVSILLHDENGKAVFAVQDSGSGVADGDKKRIFDRFYRCDSSRTLPGNGLGLPMVQAIVTIHGGTIKVLDAPEGGAIFEVELPLSMQEESKTL